MDELTLNDFVAYLIYAQRNNYAVPLWLAMKDELREKCLRDADVAFREWKKHETNALEARDDRGF